MDLDALKEALGEETHQQLMEHIASLEGDRDSFKQEMIKNRTHLKAKASEIEKANADLVRSQAEMLERLGVESLEQLKEIDPKGQADAVKQFELKLKKAEQTLTERQSAYDELHGRYRGSLADAAMRKALAGHEWIDPELVADHVSKRLAWEDDTVLYRTDDGLNIPIAEGLQTLAKVRPHLLKMAGPGGSGYRGKGAHGDAKQELTRAQLEALPPVDRVKFFKSGGQLSE